MSEERLAESPHGRRWTGADDYIEALVRERDARRLRQPEPRTEPETPRFTLSTLPFLALLGALAVLSVGIIVAAWPGSAPDRRMTVALKEQGYAAKGWMQEAQKEMH